MSEAAIFAVIDDYGDNWEHGTIVHSAGTLEDAQDWAENENYHSASIVQIRPDGTREKL